jgi:hypothetical protein
MAFDPMFRPMVCARMACSTVSRSSADPRSVPPEEIADLEVRATFLAGRQVYGADL